MRNILMAGAAIVVATSDLAYAQTPANPSQGQLVAPYGAGPATFNNNNSWGIANTPSGGASAGPLSTIYAPNVNAVPAPGTIVIRLNGRVEADIAGTFSSLNTGSNGASRAYPLGSPNGYKLNPVGIGSYARLYPAFDGLAANGLRYGAAAEIRENFYAGTTGTTNGGSFGAATGPSANASAQTLWVRAAFTYLASDQAGIVRLGQGAGVLSLFDNGIFTSQLWDGGIGNLNGGGPGGYAPSGAQPPFVWLSQTGADVANSKIVYLSPQYYGFDAGVQYAPNAGNAFTNSVGSSPLQTATCNQAGPNCISVTSGNDTTRFYNQVGGGVRYQQLFGAVDFKAYGFAQTAQKENLTTGPYFTPAQIRAGVAGATTGNIRYDNLAYYTAGTAITAANFTFAVDYIGGAVNGQSGMRPTGAPNLNAILPGLTYAYGPITAGIEFGEIWSQGAVQLTGATQRHEYEFAFGGSYKLAPGVQLAAEYQYAYRHQNGWNFATGALGYNGSTQDAQSQQVILATILTW